MIDAARWRIGLSHAEAITSLGETLSETALLYRAGISNVGLSDFIDARGQRVMLCASPALPADLPAADRLVALAAHALSGVARRLAALPVPGGGVPVILIGTPERFGRGGHRYELTEDAHAFIDRLRTVLPSRWAMAEIEPFPAGRAAGALAMARAMQLTESGREVIWGGVDSALDWTVLEALERADRLLTQENVDGVRPGEAAAFARVTAPEHGHAHLVGLGLSREPHPVGDEATCRSEGFSQALTQAVEPLRAARVRCALWMFDATHEQSATHEIQNLIARFSDVIGEQTDLQTPLRELGDVGAAALPLMAALAMQAWRDGLARADVAVLAAGSDEGARGAMLLAACAPGTSIPRVGATEQEVRA